MEFLPDITLNEPDTFGYLGARKRARVKFDSYLFPR